MLHLFVKGLQNTDIPIYQTMCTAKALKTCRDGNVSGDVSGRFRAKVSFIPPYSAPRGSSAAPGAGRKFPAPGGLLGVYVLGNARQ